MLPVNTMSVSPAPVPTEKVSPRVVDRVMVPLAAFRLTCSGLLTSSVSETAIKLLLPDEKTSGVFSLTVCVPGTMLPGGVLLPISSRAG